MTDPTYTIWPYDCIDAMTPLMDEESVHCVVTSPPYFNLRDYETGKWRGGDPTCSHEHSWVDYPGATGAAPRNIAANRAKSIRRNGGICPCGARFDDGQIGHEATPAEYVARLVQVARAVRRVLRKDGTFWLNLGDSYGADSKWGGSSGGKHVKALHGATGIGRRRVATGFASKQLLGIPWRVAFALQDDGWYLRQAIVWRKTNPMPESVKDRCTRSYEHIFMFSRSPRYFYDAAAIAEPAICGWRGSKFHEGKTGEHQLGRSQKVRPSVPKGGFGGKGPAPGSGQQSFRAIRETRNRRDVWTVATRPFKGAHFATFPPDLIEPCILAGCPRGGGCPRPVRRIRHYGPRRAPPRAQRRAVRVEPRLCRNGASSDSGR